MSDMKYFLIQQSKEIKEKANKKSESKKKNKKKETNSPIGEEGLFINPIPHDENYLPFIYKQSISHSLLDELTSDLSTKDLTQLHDDENKDFIIDELEPNFRNSFSSVRLSETEAIPFANNKDLKNKTCIDSICKVSGGKIKKKPKNKHKQKSMKKTKVNKKNNKKKRTTRKMKY